MSQERDSIIDKIKKLLNVTVENGASPGLEEVHQKKARELMEKHQISMLDVEAKKYNEGILEHPLYDKLTEGKAPPAWAGNFVDQIARAFDCSVILYGGGTRRNYRVTIVGHDSDVKLYTYFIETMARVLLPQAEAAARAATDEMGERKWWSPAQKANFNRSYKTSFMEGAGVRLRFRLQDYRKQAVADSPQSGALVLVKSDQIKKWNEQKHPGMGKAGPVSTHHAAAREGIKAAGSVDLQAGLTRHEPAVAALTR